MSLLHVEIRAKCQPQTLHSTQAKCAVAIGGCAGSGQSQGLFKTTNAAL